MFKVPRKERLESLAARSRLWQPMPDLETAVPKTPIPIADVPSIPPQRFDRPFDEVEEEAKRRRKKAGVPPEMPNAENADDDRVSEAPVAHPQKATSRQPTAKPSFRMLEEGHVADRVAPKTRSPSSSVDLQAKEIGVIAETKLEIQHERAVLPYRSDQGSKVSSQPLRTNEERRPKDASNAGGGSRDIKVVAGTAPSVPLAASKPESEFRTACVEIAAAYLRLHLRYLWLDELSVMAGMDQHAFRVAVNEQTAISKDISRADIKNRVSVLAKEFAQLARFSKPPANRTEGIARGFDRSIASPAYNKEGGRGS